MRFKKVVDSTRLNQKSEAFSKAALESAVEKSGGPEVVALTVEHNPTIPPFGKVLSAKLQQADDREWELVNEIETFDKAERLQLFDNSIAYEMSSESDKRPFTHLKMPQSDCVCINLDVRMIENKEALKDVLVKLEEIAPVELSFSVRHSPDPISIFLLLFGSNLAADFVKAVTGNIIDKLAEKVGEKLLDKTIDRAIAGTLELAEKAAQSSQNELQKAVPAFKTITKRLADSQHQITGKDLDKIMFVEVLEGDPTIELAFMLVHAKDVDEALTDENLDVLKRHAEQLSREWKIAKVQYLLRDGVWVFNFLLTPEGKVLASETAFNRLNTMLKSQGNPEIIPWTRIPYHN